MFARTERLLLRPGWAEDAPALARADRRRAGGAQPGDRALALWARGCRGLSCRAARPRPAELPDHRADRWRAAHRRILRPCRRPSGGRDGLLDRSGHWGQGFATEAGLALIEIARTLGCRLEARTSSTILRRAGCSRLGFKPTGVTAPAYSCARGGEAMSSLQLSLMGAKGRRWRPRRRRRR